MLVYKCDCINQMGVQRGYGTFRGELLEKCGSQALVSVMSVCTLCAVEEGHFGNQSKHSLPPTSSTRGAVCIRTPTVV